MFALLDKETGRCVGFRVSSNADGEYCTSEEYILEDSKYSDNIWVVTDRKIAEKAAISTAEWYNAGFNTPRNEYIGQLEVVELTAK
jgi:hypothetical protein